MNNSEYWAKRFTTLESSLNQVGQGTYASIEPAFIQAQKEIQSQIDTWMVRVAKNNQVTMAEARKLLNSKQLAEFKWNVQDYIQYGQANALDAAWIKELENASARVHISKLEALKISTQHSLEKAFGNELDAVDDMAKKVFTDDYYHSCFEVQNGFNIGWNIGQVDDKKLAKLISKPWTADGKTFSDRIWQSKSSMISDLHTELTRTCLLGKAPDAAIKNMTKFVDGKFKNAKAQAGRLVMTEQAFFASAAQKEAFDDLDVEEFEVVATLDSRTSPVCRAMDGKHFPMSDFQPGMTAPPFHPWCRSCTAPFFDDEWADGHRAARDEETGQTYYVPSDMKYPEWKEKFVDGGDISGMDVYDMDGMVHYSKQRLKPDPESDMTKEDVFFIQKLSKLKDSGVSEDEYTSYLDIINNHQNPSIKQLYSKHADEIAGVKLAPSKGAAYQPSSNTLTFNFNNSIKYPDINKYDTLAHEYGHFFDAKVSFEGTHFTEMEAVRKATGFNAQFSDVVSSSDEFLTAIRKDKEHIQSLFTSDAKADMLAHHASHGVQDAIDGLFSNSRIYWGHGEKYYNRKYSDIVYMDKLAKTSSAKALQQVYKGLGFDASNQSKVKMICRQYGAASEAWANIMSAEVCGGESLEYVKKYLPNSYHTMIEILKGVT